MEQHFTSQELRDFASGELPKEKARAVVVHLLRGCHTCRAASTAVWNPAQAAPDAYNSAFDRVFAALRAGVGVEPAAVEPALAAANSSGREPVEELLQRAWDLRYESPAEMQRLARLAVLASNSLAAEVYGAVEVADVQCRASAAYGNACRVAGELEEAQRSLERAAELFDQGTGDPLIRAQLYEFQASLESALGNERVALTALDAACAIHLERGDRHMAGRALIIKGLYTGYAGRPREALRLTQRGLDLTDETRDSGLVLSAIHNQLWFLVECGRAREARTVLRAHRDRLATGEAQRLDLLWLDGRIKAGLRDEEGALRDLEAAEQCFTATGRRSRAANVKIEQAAIQLRRGDSVQALALIRAAEQMFEEIEIPQNTRISLAFVRRTLAERVIPAAFVLRLADTIRRGQPDAARA